jgi:anti-anti-sigma factor
MEIVMETRDNVTIIYIKGRLDGNNTSEAQDRIMPKLIAGCRIVIDLAGCDYVSSAGLRLLLMIAKQLTSQQGKWAISCASEEIRDVMEMTGFNQFFTHYTNVADAVKAIGG